MTSLFTLIVTRGSEVPVIDPRLIPHLEALAVVNANQEPAAPVDQTIVDEAALSAQPSAVAAVLSDGTPSST